MTFYMCLIMLTELMMIAMILHVIFYSGFTKVQKFWYLATFISIMLCAIAELFVHCGYYKPSFRIPLTILTVMQFSIAPLLGVFFTGALGLHREAKIASFIFSLNFLVEVVLVPFGLVFYFNEEGYFRGDLFIIYEIMYFLSLAYLIVSMIIAGKRFSHRDFWTIIMVLVILISGIIPMMLFKLNITYIAIAISASLCYIYYNDLVQQDIKADYMANQERISSMQEHIISGLSNLIENRDLETGEHINRTSTYVKIIAKSAVKEGVYTDIIDDHFVTLLYTLAPMHDIGKIIVSDSILKKPGKLTVEEYNLMKRHAEIGGTVVKEVLNGLTDEEYLDFASDIATYHHEWWNGRGYPKGLKEEEIPLCARIMALADVFDALISVRCYKEAIPIEDAFKIIESEKGTHFDPLLVDVMLKYKDEFIDYLNK